MKRLIKNIEKLRMPAKQVTFLNSDGKINSTVREETEATIANLKELLEKHPEYIALSAPQIGVDKRIICVRFDTEIKVFINPIITKKAKYTIAVETWPMMPNAEILVTRPEEITLIYHNGQFKYEDNKLLGSAAKIFDQQAQLLDGVLPSDLGLVSNILEDGKFADLSEDEMKEAVAIYKQFIAIKTDKLKAELENNAALAAQYKQLKFTEDVINDRIQVIANPDEEKTTAPLNRGQRRALDKMTKAIKKRSK